MSQGPKGPNYAAHEPNAVDIFCKGPCRMGRMHRVDPEPKYRDGDQVGRMATCLMCGHVSVQWKQA